MCSSSSCSCHKPADSGSEKTESVGTMTRAIDVKPSRSKLLKTNNNFENTQKLSMVSPDFLKEGSSCGYEEKELGKDGRHEKSGKEGINLEPGKDRKNKESIKSTLIKGVKYAYIELPAEISKWMLIGIFFAGMISYAIPENLIQNYLGGGFSSMLVMLLVGIRFISAQQLLLLLPQAS